MNKADFRTEESNRLNSLCVEILLVDKMWLELLGVGGIVVGEACEDDLVSVDDRQPVCVGMINCSSEFLQLNEVALQSQLGRILVLPHLF